MTGNITLAIIKPTAFKKGYTGPILCKIQEAGFLLKAMKLIHLSREQAMEFYKVHSERPFYNSLVNFMSSGSVVTAILEKENAVESFRQMIGATDPALAEEGSIRKLYGTSLQENAVHGSDSDENAIIESDFMFSKIERF